MSAIMKRVSVKGFGYLTFRPPLTFIFISILKSFSGVSIYTICVYLLNLFSKDFLYDSVSISSVLQNAR